MLDIQAEDHELKMPEITRLQRMKTGELISASCEAGAILGKASDRARQLLHAYAHDIGLAFQITDDLLDVEGNEVATLLNMCLSIRKWPVMAQSITLWRFELYHIGALITEQLGRIRGRDSAGYFNHTQVGNRSFAHGGNLKPWLLPSRRMIPAVEIGYSRMRTLGESDGLHNGRHAKFVRVGKKLG